MGPLAQPFSKAGRSIIRYRVHHELRDPHDERRDLWRSFLEVVRLSLPAAVLMENVPDMALDKEMFILRNMVEELEQLAMPWRRKSLRRGVTEFRSSRSSHPCGLARSSVVPLAGGVERSGERLERYWRHARGGRRLAAGRRRTRLDLLPGPTTSFQRNMREGVPEADRDKLFDHITRPVREDDAQAFAVMDATTKYSDLPAEVKRYRDDIFDDKYKRLDEDDLSRTITAHIAKDGTGTSIHDRTDLDYSRGSTPANVPRLVPFRGPPVRRVQADWQCRPPLAARRLGEAVEASLARGEKALFTTQSVADRLADWFDRRDPLSIPWLRAETRWQVIAAETLLERAESDHVRLLWPTLRMWKTPQALSAVESELRGIGRLIGREQRVAKLLELARLVV